jgi:hypothetical protein
LKNEFGIDIWFCSSDVEILRLDEAEKEFVDDLEMWPSGFHDRLVFFWIKDVANGI